MKNLCLYLLRSVSGALLVFLIFSMAVGVGATVEPPPAFLIQWTVDGFPCGVAVDSAGNAYVSDVISHSIQKFDTDGTFLKKWDSYGQGQGQFRYPYGVAVDSEGNVYVADMYNHRIQKFEPDGTFLKKWGSYGQGQGQFRYPYGVAGDSEGKVYVADTYNCRIQKFEPDGTFLKKWGSYGQGQGQFRYPYGVAVDSVGYVYVADTENRRIQKFGNPSIDVDIRIKGQSLLNVKSRGVLPVAILGTNTFDVTEVDPATVLLEGVAPLRWAFEDVGTSHDPFIDKEDAFNCTTEGPDGLLDLTLKFRTQEVVAALGEVEDRDAVVLTLTANLKKEFNSVLIRGEDVIVILKKP